MRGNVVQRVLRASIAVVAVGLMTVAVLWVSDVRFKDQASAYDCGVPLGAAWHGRTTLNPSLFPRDEMTTSRGQPTGLFSVPAGTSVTTTVCAGEARTRVALAAGAILVAVAAVMVSRRRWGRSPPMTALA